ncbi:protein Niban 1 [Engraulis encrasicolus]|uniref:protein Niban 1 n=1 Tax=Engraulis encrasicolus TaxID=184585 RepID=UPI002FD08785
MGGSASSQLDETTSSHIRGQTEGDLKAFAAQYRRQYCVALCSRLQEELEQQNTSPALLLKHREPCVGGEVVYEAGMMQCEDGRKWRDRWAVIKDNTLELHDNQEMWKKGSAARQVLVLVGGDAVTTREKYEALLHKDYPDLNNGQEDSSTELLPPNSFPVYLKLPYRRHVYLCCHDNEQRRRFLSVLTHAIRHQNHDSLHKPSCETQAFLAAVDFHRQETGRYESWDMLVGDDTQVLTHLVVEGCIPYLQRELFPQLKGKRAEKRRAWLSLVEAAHTQVLSQVDQCLQSLKEECSATAQQQGALLRANMDQISSSQAFLETKLQGLVSEQAHSVCAEHVTPYLTSVLEELLEPVNRGFQAVRQLCEERLDCLCKDVRGHGWTYPQVHQALQQAGRERLEDGFQGLDTLHDKLQGLQQRFGFSNTPKLVQGAQRDMQQLMDNAIYTFESLLQSAKDNAGQLGSVMDKAKARVLKQYDYDSSTVRKRFFQEALMDITLPVLRRHLAPSCRPKLESFEQYIFADCTDFIRVENVYEDILTKTLTPEVSKVVKEAASQKRHNLFVDSADLQAISQGSLSMILTDSSRTPPRSAPSSPPLQPGLGRMLLGGEIKPSPLAASVPGVTVTSAEEVCSPEVPQEQQQQVQQEEEQKQEQGEHGEVEQKDEMEKQSGEEKVQEEQTKVQQQSEPPPAQEGMKEQKEEDEDKEKEKEKVVVEEKEKEKEEEEKMKEETGIEEVIQQVSSVQVSSSPPPAAPKEDAPAPEEPLPPPASDVPSAPPVASVAPSTPTGCTDRAFYINPPAGVPAGSAVPLCEEEDSTVTPVPTATTTIAATTTSTAPQATQGCHSPEEDSGGEMAETAEACEAPPVEAVEETSVTPARVEGGAEEDSEGASGGVNAAEEESGSREHLSSSEPTAEGAEAPPCGTAEEEEEEGEEGEEEEEGGLDSVKAIRDLVMEVIEVEDVITPCPDGRPA